MDRTERIRKYEAILDRVEAAARGGEGTGDACGSLEQDIAQLEQYYTSPEWKADFEADEAGLLPEGLKRGVLSEDGIWHALEWFREHRSSGTAAEETFHE